jgi:hypothetical protein
VKIIVSPLLVGCVCFLAHALSAIYGFGANIGMERYGENDRRSARVKRRECLASARAFMR